jgi:hypothetical protein
MYPEIFVKKFDTGCNGEPGINLHLFRHQITLTASEAKKLSDQLQSALWGCSVATETANKDAL